MNAYHHYITPDWPAPKHIKAYTTTRHHGYSLSPYNSFNIAAHINDNMTHVNQNRALLQKELECPSEPLWLNQIHSSYAIDSKQWQKNIDADAILSTERHDVCAILTADCLPILLCNTTGEEVAAIHAGWRGLLNGIITNTVSAMRSSPKMIMSWLGPAIGPTAFEVNNTIMRDFISKDPNYSSAFTISNQRYFADIFELARIELKSLNINQIYGGGVCTVNDDRFFSYRGDFKITGRMGHLIWIS